MKIITFNRLFAIGITIVLGGLLLTQLSAQTIPLPDAARSNQLSYTRLAHDPQTMLSEQELIEKALQYARGEDFQLPADLSDLAIYQTAFMPYNQAVALIAGKSLEDYMKLVAPAYEHLMPDTPVFALAMEGSFADTGIPGAQMFDKILITLYADTGHGAVSVKYLPENPLPDLDAVVR